MIFLGASSALAAAPDGSQASMRLILQRQRQLLLAKPAPDAKEVASLIQSLGSDGRWPDIDYADDQPAGWKTAQHLVRLKSLARALADPSVHDPALENAAFRALDDWTTHHYKNPNWWHNDIGTPGEMLDILLLLGPRLSHERYAAALAVVNQFGRPKPNQAANTIWEARLGLEYAALTKDAPGVAQYAAVIAHEIQIGAGQGIQSDYSFYQHGPRLQQLSYGGAFINFTSQIAWLLHGTPWAFPPEKIAVLANKILEGDQWMMRGSYTIPATLDRASTRPNALLKHVPQEAAQWLIDSGAARAPELAAFIKRAAGKAPPLTGFRAYPRSDFAAYQRPDFAAFLKTVSSRTRPAEIGLNGENLLGHLMDCGTLYLLRAGPEYYNLPPVWDWDHLPGVTWARGAGKLDRTQIHFAGAVTDGVSGATVMDYRFATKDAPPHTLTAKKFWVFHDNMILCLIADLQTRRVDAPVETALDQCRLDGPVSAILPDNTIETLADGDYPARALRGVQHHGFLYAPLNGEPLRIKIGPVSGSWRRLSKAAAPDPVTAQVFLPIMENPAQPPHNSGGYLIADAASPKAAVAILQSPSWKILQNDSAAQAVQFADGDLFIAFHHPGTSAGVEVTAPCLVLLTPTHACAADPTQKGGTLTLKTAKQNLTLNLPAGGATQTQKFPLAPR